MKSREIQRFVMWGFFILIVLGGIIWLSRTGGGLIVEMPTRQEALSVREVDRIKGNLSADAPLTLIEYSDFECPSCGFFFPLVSELVEEFEEDLRFVYRHFPLSFANSELAARATEAAGNQGKFFEMHDLLFNTQSDWSGRNARNEFVSYAEELDLDLQQFESDLNAQETRLKVQEDRNSGTALNVSGTPTFFLNGERLNLEDMQTYEDFRGLIIEALEEAKDTTDEEDEAPEITEEESDEATDEEDAE